MGWAGLHFQRYSKSPFGLPIIMLCVDIKLSLYVFPRFTAPPTDPPGTAAILLAPLRLAVIESLPRRKVWCPKRRKVSKAKTASMPCNFVLTNRTTFLLRTVSEQREVSGQSISFIFQF